MKNIFKNVWVALIILLTFSCSKEGSKIGEFTIKEQAEFIVPKTSIVGLPQLINSPAVTTNIEKDVKNSGSNLDNVKEIRLQKMNLVILSPSTQTFSFLNSIRIFIKVDGLPDKLIASKVDIPASVGQTLELETTGEVIDEYVKKPQFTIRAETTTDETFTQDIHIRTDMDFLVRAALIR